MEHLFFEDASWYCIQTAPRHEHKVAGLLTREAGVEVFAPKIRFRRSRAGRAAWVTEALFPGYVFARFPYLQRHRQLRATHGVKTIVQFGARPVQVDQTVISQLQTLIAGDETLIVSEPPEPSMDVVVISGPLQGLQLLVTRVMPARQRIAVLMEILGGEREVELSLDSAVAVKPRLNIRFLSAEN